MPRDVMQMFAYEQRRRPALAALAANIENMSDDDIDAAAVPIPWMRDALRVLKQKQTSSSYATEIEQYIVDSVNPDPIGVMCEWTGQDIYIKISSKCMSRCQGMMLLIKPGQLLWIGERGIWIDTIYTSLIDPVIRQNIISRGKITRTGYNVAVREQICRSHPIETAETSVSRGIRFFRPA